MEKNQVLSLSASLLTMLLLLIAACKKDAHTEKEGYERVAAYKNELSVSVELRRGVVWQRSLSMPDTLVYRDTIYIAPGTTYEQKQFICTRNCIPEGMYATSVVSYIEIAKILIGDKVRMDSSCQAVALFSKMQFFKCEELVKGPNIFNPRRFAETRDAGGNVVRSEYVFNEEDQQSVN
ncbi:hypothetical protein [Niabella beijingensis]|uniref:hypothetical protein n=1 Tax=Niabella beijingensis TaxID=2872700 RepID=UPI001CC07EB7|nr:hypothetical protein [Niabella beijingensis]MBZ4188154.1 hypothetical protein [Niabella beijingensis]